jgi:polar amino acid transport system permease protein
MFDWPSFWESFPVLLSGLGVTVELAVVTMAGSLVVATAMALGRLYGSRPLAMAIGAWTDIWIATPLMIQLYWLYYVMPSFVDLRLPGMLIAILGLLFNNSAFLAEVFRSAIASIRDGQWYAARALGMSETRAFMRVIAPQAFSRALPATANIWVELFKNTSIVSTVAVTDITFKALELRNDTFRTLEVLSALALIYLALGYPQAKLADWLYSRIKVRE